MTSFGYRDVGKNHQDQQKFENKTYNFVVITVAADGLASSGAGTSAVTLLKKFVSELARFDWHFKRLSRLWTYGL